MKLGFVSAILPDLTLEEVFAFAASSKISAVELMCWPVGKAERRYAGVTHLNVDGLDGKQAEGTRSLADRYGVTISGLGYYPNPLAPDADEAKTCVDHLYKVIAGAKLLGLTNVNTFVGRDWTKSIADNWPRFLQTWKPIVDFAEKTGVRIGIENCPMFFTSDEWPGGKNLAISPAIWRRMFDAIPSPYFGLNYDPSHLVWQQMDYIAPLREFKDRIFHVHAKDVRIDREKLDRVGILANPLEYHCPKLPGLGEINWGRFLSVLGDTGYAGAICVEVEDRAYERSLDDRKCAVTQSISFLRNFAAFG